MRENGFICSVVLTTYAQVTCRASQGFSFGIYSTSRTHPWLLVAKVQGLKTSWRLSRPMSSPGFTAAGNGCCLPHPDIDTQVRVQQSMNLESNARACGTNVGSIVQSTVVNLSRSWNISRHENACATKQLKCAPAQLWAMPANTSQKVPSAVGVLAWSGTIQNMQTARSRLVLEVKAI